MIRRLLTSLELEWKIIMIAAVLFTAFLWPVQHYYLHRMRTLLEQSIDPNLDGLLRTQIAETDSAGQTALLSSMERHRQWRAMIPVIMDEQRRSIVWFSLALFSVSLALALYILSRMTKPLKRLSKAADTIGKGESANIDVTSSGSLRRLEASMAQMQEELHRFRDHAQAEGMEIAWRDIARIMAHEIKNPLTPIRLTLDSIAEKIERNEQIRASDLKKYADRITLQIEHLEDLVNEFRSFAREPDVRLRQIAIMPLIQAVATDMKPSIETTANGSATAAADPRLLNQVLLNLWKNALEGGATTVIASLSEQDDTVTIAIADNGPGIPKDRIEQVWIPYVTYKKGGTGLGLPVVKRLVESMYGSVSLASTGDKQNHGVTVTITLRKKV
ncbi:MAG: HAMP domain-containing protein [Chitinispirillaceae bacterium]|nr:HAMP domain-containing protein [Chitinispirillaceae bacterium]